jgi:hypothetical protein
MRCGALWSVLCFCCYCLKRVPAGFSAGFEPCVAACSGQQLMSSSASRQHEASMELQHVWSGCCWLTGSQSCGHIAMHAVLCLLLCLSGHQGAFLGVTYREGGFLSPLCAFFCFYLQGGGVLITFVCFSWRYLQGGGVLITFVWLVAFYRVSYTL